MQVVGIRCQGLVLLEQETTPVEVGSDAAYPAVDVSVGDAIESDMYFTNSEYLRISNDDLTFYAGASYAGVVCSIETVKIFNGYALRKLQILIEIVFQSHFSKRDLNPSIDFSIELTSAIGRPEQ